MKEKIPLRFSLLNPNKLLGVKAIIIRSLVYNEFPPAYCRRFSTRAGQSPMKEELSACTNQQRMAEWISLVNSRQSALLAIISPNESRHWS